jgi:hypothetical protein
MLKESTVITNELVEILQSGHYRVTTVVPLAENPTMNIYHFNREELDDFLEGYGEYAEFIISVEQLTALT